MTERPSPSAWSAFWRQSPAGPRRPGCLPRGGTLADVLSAAWRHFAGTLPRGAHVLDVATGDGRVMGWLLSARADLRIEGVDLARELPAPPAGTRARGGVAMENLPHRDRSLDAVVSQFGFEYGDIAAAAAEFARVLGPAGTIALVTHRGDGPIAVHNLDRRRAIEWAVTEQALPEIARGALASRGPDSPVPAALSEAPHRGATLFGPRSAAWEIAEALRQTLDRGRGDDPAAVRAMIDRIEDQAHGEMARIDALQAACRRIAEPQVVTHAFGAAGLAEREIHALRDRAGTAPFADFRLITRAT